MTLARRFRGAFASRLLRTVLGIALLCGCGSHSLLQQARTLRPGESRLGAALHGNVASEGADVAVLPNLEVAYRLGLASGVDCGVQLYLAGARADVKVQLADRDGLVLSLDFGGGYGTGEGPRDSYGGGDVSLLLGVDIDSSQLVFAARLSAGQATAATPIADITSVSGFLGEAGLLSGWDYWHVDFVDAGASVAFYVEI